jgi:hypothetical protein
MPCNRPRQTDGVAEAAEADGGVCCHRRKHDGGAALRAALRGRAVGGRAARACRKAVLTYVSNPVHRLDSPPERTKGWCIGRGVVESAGLR